MKLTLSEIYETPRSYEHIEFGSNTLNDKINDALLKDINIAAGRAGIGKVKITTAITGHNKLSDSGYQSRHVKGDAVDINDIDGKNYHNKAEAISMGVLDKVQNFVKELNNIGYCINKEMGCPKAVLYFGFGGHEDHIHVSNKTDDYTDEDALASKSSQTSTGTTQTDKLANTDDTRGKAWELMKKIAGDIISPYIPTTSESLDREIDRFKTLIK